MPASFSEQLLREREMERRREAERRRTEDEEKGMVNRILLARMHTLEEGFREVLKEVKDLTRSTANSSRRDSDIDVPQPRTPRKHSLSEGKARASPKKAPKGKEAQRPGGALRMEPLTTPSPESVRSTVEHSARDGAEASGEVLRPSTALQTPEPQSGRD
jgi:hypothetical protein